MLFRSGEVALTLDLGKNLSLTTEIGRVLVSKPASFDYWAWGVGLGYELSPWASVDLSYTQTSLSRAQCLANLGAGDACGWRVMVGLSLSTSLFRRNDKAAGDD